MPRFPRYNVKSKYLHIMTQGHNKSYIFNKEEDIKYYIKIMYDLAHKFDVKIIAYCIMNNHTHMLVEVEDVNKISEYMHRVNTKYGIYYNRKYDLVGYVFRDRYRLQEIYDQRQLNTCIQYIYDNPVKAGICSNSREYLYSNYKEVTGELTDDFVLCETEDDKENLMTYILKETLCKNKITLDNLKNNSDLLENTIWILKNNNISLRSIAENLEMGREKVRRIYNNIELKNGRIN